MILNTWCVEPSTLSRWSWLVLISLALFYRWENRGQRRKITLFLSSSPQLHFRLLENKDSAFVFGKQ